MYLVKANTGMCRPVLVEPALPMNLLGLRPTVWACVPLSDSPKCGQEALHYRVADRFEEPREVVPY